MSDIKELTDRYVRVWNEPDAGRRRALIEELWAPGGVHYVDVYTMTGHDEIEGRITRAYDQWVAGAGFVFRSLHNADGHHNVVRFNWEMAPAAGGKAATVGFIFLVLDEAGRITADYQFIDWTS